MDGTMPIESETQAGPKPEWAMSRREAEQARRAREGLPPLRRRWPWVVLVLVLVAGGVAAYVYQTQEAARAAEPAVVEAPIPEIRKQINPDEFGVIAPATLERRVRVIGTLSPSRQVELSSQTGGRVEDVSARPGDRVTEGQILVKVDVERLNLELAQTRSSADATRAQLQLSENQLDRAVELVDRGVGTTSTLEQAQSAVDAQRASLAALADQVAAAELMLTYANVTAPYDGILSVRGVEPGAVVSAGVTLMTVVDLSTVELVAQVPMASAPLVATGQRVSINVDGLADRTFVGEVVRIAPTAAEGTRTIPVYVSIDNPEGVLLGGMFATGEIVIAEQPDALAVPTAVIRSDDEGSFVLVLGDDALERRNVEIGETWQGGLTQITEGLAAGDRVIIVPLASLEPGDLFQLVGN